MPALARLRRIAARLVPVLLGLAAGAVVAESAFRLRDHGAFPHLNVYRPDPALGVRLQPGAEERVAFNGNPVTRVRINRDGYRGADFPPPAPGEILVVGDSQVFGLGVDEAESFSSVLGTRLPGRPVLDLGVPTYGPLEYDAVLEETLARRALPGADPPPTVIYTVNMANDLFEAARPNVQRHRVWDGWAVRMETAPHHVTSFPGRALIFRDSHAFFALRALLHARGEAPEAGLRSEGSWEDLLGAAAHRRGERDTLASLVGQEEQAQRRLERAASAAYPSLMGSPEGREYVRTHGSPEDIVVQRYRRVAAESSRPVRYTARTLVKGARIRRRIEEALRARAEQEIDRERAREILASLDERKAIEDRIAGLRASTEAALATLSPIRAPLERAKAICDRHRARLVVLVLPVDVEVSGAEWAKYDQDPEDMSDVRLLEQDVKATAASLGLEAVDAFDALRAAEPGAFLKGDLHMSPAGHRAVAALLASALSRPAPAPAREAQAEQASASRRR